MNDTRTIKKTFTNAKSENNLIIKHHPNTTNKFISLIEYKLQK